MAEEYPEHEKLLAVRDDRDTVQNFYDWLGEQRIVLAEYGAPKERTLTCPRCDGTCIEQAAMTDRQRQLVKRGALPRDEWPKCERCGGRGKIIEEYIDGTKLFPISLRPEELIARFFEIDIKAFNDEKEAMYQALVALNRS